MSIAYDTPTPARVSSEISFLVEKLALIRRHICIMEGTLVRLVDKTEEGKYLLSIRGLNYIAVAGLLADLNIKTGHLNEQFGLQRKDLEHIVNIYSNDFCSQGNPREYNFEETMKLLEAML